MRIILGYLVIFGLYFLVKSIMFLPLKIVPGTVQYIGSEEQVINTPKGAVRSMVTFPVIAFRVKDNGTDTGMLHTTQQHEVMSFQDYKPGDAVKVAYSSGHTEKARIYSASEYWAPLSNMLILFFACLGWTAGYYFVRRFRTEGR